MRVGIVGSRDFPRLDWVVKYVRLHTEHRDVIVSGGAKGVDLAAEKAAKARSSQRTLVFLPNYERYGKKAPIIRNAEIVENSDRVVAFWDGFSTGTAHTIRLAKEKGLPLEVCTPDGKLDRSGPAHRMIEGSALEAMVKQVFAGGVSR